MRDAITYLGPAGTFTEAALLAMPESAEAEPVPSGSVTTAIAAVRDGSAAGAAVPLENSVEGSVASTLDELARDEPLVIGREVYLPVGFSLLVRAGTALAGISRVATHPHAEAQCRTWLRDHLPDADVAMTTSTARAADGVADGEYDAAVSAPIAARHYDLVELETDIADNPGAMTRFVLLRRPGPPAEPTGNDLTSLVAFVDNRPGALVETLTEFAQRGVNLTRIESRPTKERIGQYCFFLDAEGHVADARIGAAMTALWRRCAEVRYLGSYPRASGEARPVADAMADRAFDESAVWLAALRERGRA